MNSSNLVELDNNRDLQCLRLGGAVFVVPDCYENETARLESFCCDNWPSNVPVAIQDLAKAGFYYLGRGDRVRCYYCSGVLYDWEDGDTAIGEHRKHFPQCDFLRRYDATAAEASQSSYQPDNCLDNDKITLTNWRASDAVQTVREMDIYPFEVIECAVKRLILDDGEDMFDSSTLLDTIFQIEGKMSVESICSAVNTLTIEQRQCKSVAALQREVETLKNSKSCKICMDAVVAILFLPCRHLVCCVDCAKQVRCCPICRGRIVANIKAYCN